MIEDNKKSLVKILIAHLEILDESLIMEATQARFHISSNHCLDLFVDKSLINRHRSLQSNGKLCV